LNGVVQGRYTESIFENNEEPIFLQRTYISVYMKSIATYPRHPHLVGFTFKSSLKVKLKQASDFIYFFQKCIFPPSQLPQLS
jgi:hypothetical protein